jgi:N-acetylglucosamine-6-sulfatase
MPGRELPAADRQAAEAQGALIARLGAIVGSLAAATAVGAVALSPDASAAAGKPNVVVIVTDDQTYRDLHQRGVMPKTRRLIGGRGVSFRRYYASNPLSCPSRTTNLTGQYSKNHKLTRNQFRNRVYCSKPKLLNYRNLLPVWLQKRGYRTLHVGRFFNAFGLGGRTRRVAPGWDYWANPVETNVSAGALFFGYRLNINGELTGKFGSRRKRKPKAYFTDVITRLGLKQVRRTDRSTPFYLAVDHRAPHEDLAPPVGPQPAPRHGRSLRGKRLPTPPNYNEADVSDKAQWLRNSLRLSSTNSSLIKRRYVRRLRSLRSVDDSVGRIVRTLRRLGELKRTYVFFTSDNGFFNGEHRISKGKFRPYEEATHVPLLVRGPGIPRGKVSRALVANIDLVPTIVHVTGARAGRAMDGRSVLPFARKPRKRSRRPILLESFSPEPERMRKRARGSSLLEGPSIAEIAREPSPKPWKAIVIGQWKLTRFKSQGYELYNLKRDPFELSSLDGSRRHRKVRRYLKRQLKRLVRCKGKSCRRPIRVPKA